MLHATKGHIFAIKKSELEIHCDSQDKNVQTLWPIMCVIGRPLPENGWKMANGQLLHTGHTKQLVPYIKPSHMHRG